jgi:CubicO group peptidase (beta-lactamase class C family)
MGEGFMVDRRSLLLGSIATACLARLPAARAGDQLTGAIEAELARHKVPGVSWAIVADGNVAGIGSAGVRSVGQRELVGAETRFQAASLSKTVNALCVLTLVRDGLIGLDDSANAHLDGWQLSGRDDADKVTVRMLLSHTGGVNVHGFGGYYQGDPLPSVENILDGTPPANSAAVTVEKKPGAAYLYSGGGITVLQKLVQDVTGEDYVDAMHDRVLSPLGMTDSSVRQPPLTPDLAFGHDDKGTPVWRGYNVYPEMAAAGLWTTPADIGRAIAAIFGALAGEAQALLPKDVARQIVRTKFAGAGLGVFVDDAGRITHNGVNWGFRATYLANPAKRRGYVVISNGENGEKLNESVARLLVKAQGWTSV